MTALYITVTEKHAQLSGTPVIVCGNSDYTITFTFDEEWDRHDAKTARFAYHQDGVLRYLDVQFEGDCVSVPVLHDVGEVAVGVYAGDLCTTTPARISCARCATDGNALPDIPVRDVYNELTEQLACGSGYYLMTAEDDYLVTLSGDYITAKE